MKEIIKGKSIQSIFNSQSNLIDEQNNLLIIDELANNFNYYKTIELLAMKKSKN